MKIAKTCRAKNMPNADLDFMAAAVALSMRGRGRTGPNPNVGCIIVKDGRVVGRGWTAPGGRPHAEAVALEMAGDQARGATVYVTLEPCAHVSKRGPKCSDLLIEAGVERVVVATLDPDERTRTLGIDALGKAGISVEVGVRAKSAQRAMAGFFARIPYGRPLVTLKLAVSLDGKIATGAGESQWITGPQARAHAHMERAMSDAILVGSGTVLADQPGLDCRLPGLADRSPQPVVLGEAEVPDHWQRISDPADIGELPDCNWLLVEGGAQTAAAFLREGLVDRLLLYRAPIILGEGKSGVADYGLESLEAAHGQWTRVDHRPLGADMLDLFERAA